jgi:putative spermidine/putrescine transport system substrate-binding protein
LQVPAFIAAVAVAAGLTAPIDASPPAPAPAPAQATPAPAPSAAPSPAPAAGHRLMIASRRNGEWLEALRGLYVAAFHTATGLDAEAEIWEGGVDNLRKHIKAGGWGLVQLTAEELSAGCEEGLLEKVDWSAIGGRDHYLQPAVSDCGVGASAHALVLAWDRDKFPGTPTWADFFDIARYPGKRALPRRARDVLEIALLADGVAPADVYRTLRGNDGVDRAFRKLDQLRPYLDWWESGSDATRVLGSGEVLMTAALNGNVMAANRAGGRNFGMQWAGAITDFDWWAIPRNSPEAKPAQQFLYLVGLPALEARMLAEAGAPGFAKGLADFAPPAALAASPLLPANLSAGLPTDEAFWHDNQEKLSARFTAWLAH